MTRHGALATGIAAPLFAVVLAAPLVTPVPAQAQEISAPYGQLNTGGNVVGVGLGYADVDGRRFGQFNGITDSGFSGLLDFSLAKRDDETGTWLGFFGRNLGLDNRRLRFEHNRQGDWGYFLEYSRIPRYEPYTPVTAVVGIGSPNLTLPAAGTTGVPFDLKTRRDMFALGADKFLFGNWEFQVRFHNEEKDGTRIFARGDGANFDFTPDPINYTTRQLEARANYSGSQLNVSGGYYGTTFNNQYTALNVGGLAGFTPIALPPDNQSHQLFLTGSYAFTPTTHGNFKVAYAKATQDDAFVPGVAVAAGAGNSLHGRVDTTLVQAGITSNPIPKLTLLANFRFEDRDDKTPIVVYGTPGATTTGANDARSIQTTTGKVEAGYALPYSLRLTGGIEYEEKKRNTQDIRIVSQRETTEEWSYRAELRRILSETVTGAVSYVHSERDGSPWLLTLVTAGTLGSNLIAPIHLADRKRDKVRLSINWAPTDPLTISFNLDEARDDYSTRDGSFIGPMDGRARNYAIDAGYAFSDAWQANAWASYNETKAMQKSCENAAAVTGCPATAADPVYGAEVRNKSTAVGLGFRGKPSARISLGGDLSYTDIKDSYTQYPIIPPASGVPGALPDISTKLTRLSLFGKYVLEKNSGVRLDYIYDRYTSDDWTWTNFVYRDGTFLGQNPNQKTNFVGARYYYKWQ